MRSAMSRQRLLVRLAMASGLALAADFGAARIGWADGASPPAPGQAVAPAEPAPLPLRTAVAQGLVRARGIQPQSYQSLTLELVNLAQQPLEVDLVGSYMTPRGAKSCQRLGLGPVVTPGAGPKRRPGAVVVTLAAGATSTVRVATVCLDAGKACPTTQEFAPAPDALPPVRERVLRWWADNPEAPQGAVNSAIWRDAEQVELPAPGSGRGSPREPELRLGVLFGEALYLVRDDRLVARDADGSERFLATQITNVFPVKDALYAVAQVGLGQELWRYVETGDVLWKRIAPLPEELAIASLTPVPGGGLLVATTAQILHLAPNATEFRILTTLPEGATSLSYAVASKKTVRVGFTLPATKGVLRGGQVEQVRSPLPELWDHDLTGRQPSERVKAYWNVASIAQGMGGTFALTNAGHLRVLVGESFRDQEGPVGLDEILHVGPDRLWAHSRGEWLVCVRIATGAFVRVERPLAELTQLRFDDVSGDALAIRRNGELVRIDADTGACSEVALRGAR